MHAKVHFVNPYIVLFPNFPVHKNAVWLNDEGIIVANPIWLLIVCMPFRIPRRISRIEIFFRLIHLRRYGIAKIDTGKIKKGEQGFIEEYNEFYLEDEDEEIDIKLLEVRK